MKPSTFELRTPDSVEEAVSALSEFDGEAKVLAGGQSLVPLMNFRLARPELLVDLRKVQELLGMFVDSDGWLHCGAMTSQRTVERDARVRAAWPMLGDAVPHIGHVAIRNRGTVGGSLAHADPAAELPAVCLAMDAQLRAGSSRGDRVVAAQDFFEMVFTTALEADELLLEVLVPPLPPRTGDAWLEFARRHGDFAVVGVAARVRLAEDGTCADAQLVLAGVAPTPALVPGLDALVLGEPAGHELWVELAEHAMAQVDPPEDVHASASYRRRLIRVLAVRALATAAGRARDGSLRA